MMMVKISISIENSCLILVLMLVVFTVSNNLYFDTELVYFRFLASKNK